MNVHIRPAFPLTAMLLILCSLTAARADDTEIFFNQSNGNVAPNVMLILDTSGSMDDEVKSSPKYDATQGYPTAGSCDANYYYYASSGTPTCSNANRVPVANFKCAAGLPNLGSSTAATGQFGSSFIRWGSVTKTTGSGSGKVTTTTYQWSSNLAITNGTDVECSPDAGVDGNGVDTANLYPSKNSDPAATSGIWSTAANSWWSIFGNSGNPVTFYSANYINYINDAALVTVQSKIKIMQDAAKTLVNSVSNVNMGLMRYDYHGRGAMVTVPAGPVATNGPLITGEVGSWAAAGSTPLSESLYEAYLYYSGGSVNYGNNSWSTNCTSTFTKGNGAVHCTSFTSFPFHSVAGARSPATSSGANYNTPAVLSCQKNYIIFLTDGQPNVDAGADNAIKSLPNFAAVGGACDTSSPPGANGGLCLKALAQYMYRSDLNPNVGSIQNVTTYFIGFGDTFKTDPNATAYYNYLNAAATAGGGKAFTATSLAELTAVFNQIFSEVQLINTSFSAPAVAVNAFNRTQTLDDLYISVFRPSANYHWPGNVKKYRLFNGAISDSSVPPAAAVDSATGFFNATSQSFWSAAPDGYDVTLGGAANQIPAPTSRVVYTYLGGNPASPGGLVPIDNATDINFQIGGPADPTRVDLLNWIKGMDVQDANTNGSTTDTRHVMGDPIHAQPAVVIYGPASDDTVVFAPTNDGYLHAVNARTGAELWSYIPQEILGKMKVLYDDDPSTVKHYALDGEIRILKYDINGDGTIDSAAGDRVILYFGTGRNADVSEYYALDVTDKTSPKYMWGISSATLPELGQAWSTPEIARVNINCSGCQNSQKFVLIFGGGYDSAEDGYTYVNADTLGAHIYMVDALKGALLWSAGGALSAANFKDVRMDHSIPSAVTVIDLDGDGYADRMYVGDMAAQLWRFDIKNGQPQSSLVVGGAIASLGTKESVLHPMANTRRFYSAPDVASIQKKGLPPYFNISIGSGYRSHPLDANTQDRLYSIRDYMPFTAMTPLQYAMAELPANLIVDGSLMDITAIASPVIPPSSPGWKLSLNQHGGWVGEKALAPAQTFNNQIFFTSYTPNYTASTTACTGVGSGINRIYVVNVLDGSAVLDKNKDGRLTTDERSSDLSQGGIAPQITFMFPAGNTTGTGALAGPVLGFVGVEKVNVCTFCDRRKKTYWREGTAN